jgi:deoxyribonuclease V
VPFSSFHSWEVNPQQAKEIQQRLRSQIIREDHIGIVRRVAGIDVGFESNGRTSRAAAAVLGFPELDLQETALAERPTRFPYVPGLLSFREIPVILETLNQLTVLPDLLICDGHGLAHPRRFGLASHLGLLCDLPSIGVAKSLLVGEHAPVGTQRGDWQPLIESGEVIGAALRTRPGTKPIYVSIGHRVGLATAIDFVLRCSTNYRLPETTRQAHRLASH